MRSELKRKLDAVWHDDILQVIERVRVKGWNANLDDVPEETIQVIDEMQETMAHAEEEIKELREVLLEVSKAFQEVHRKVYTTPAMGARNEL